MGKRRNPEEPGRTAINRLEGRHPTRTGIHRRESTRPQEWSRTHPRLQRRSTAPSSPNRTLPYTRGDRPPHRPPPTSTPDLPPHARGEAHLVNQPIQQPPNFPGARGDRPRASGRDRLAANPTANSRGSTQRGTHAGVHPPERARAVRRPRPNPEHTGINQTGRKAEKTLSPTIPKSTGIHHTDRISGMKPPHATPAAHDDTHSVGWSRHPRYTGIDPRH